MEGGVQVRCLRQTNGHLTRVCHHTLFAPVQIKEGVPSLLFPAGVRLPILPDALLDFETVLVAPWTHESSIVPVAGLLSTLNGARLERSCNYFQYASTSVDNTPSPPCPIYIFLCRRAVPLARTCAGPRALWRGGGDVSFTVCQREQPSGLGC